jgi:hypothetical protein
MGIDGLKVGSKVYYQSPHSNKWENGIVKEIPDNTNLAVRVVYNCGGDWDNYKDYTSALTDLRNLKPGWK